MADSHCNFNYLPTKTKTYSPNNFTIDKHRFAEVGVGYYKNIPRNRVFEIFLLAGQGSTPNFVSYLSANTVATDIFKGKYNRFLVQSDFGWIKSKWRLAISGRIFLLHYFNVIDTGNEDFEKDFIKNQPYTDAAFTARYRVSKYIDISSQVGITLSLGTNDSSSGLNTSLGLLFNVDFAKKSAE